MRKRKFAYQIGPAHENGAVADSFFEKYSTIKAMKTFRGRVQREYLVDLIKAVWGRSRPIDA